MPDPLGGGTGARGRDKPADFDGAFETLRAALMEVVDGNGTTSDLRNPVRQLCVFAHAEEVSAERLLIRFKEMWSQLPPLAGLPRGRQHNDLMARVATMCIEEFYGPRRPGETPHDS